MRWDEMKLDGMGWVRLTLKLKLRLRLAPRSEEWPRQLDEWSLVELCGSRVLMEALVNS